MAEVAKTGCRAGYPVGSEREGAGLRRASPARKAAAGTAVGRAVPPLAAALGSSVGLYQRAKPSARVLIACGGVAVLAAASVCGRVSRVGVAGSAVAVGGHRRAALEVVGGGLISGRLARPPKPATCAAVALRPQVGGRSAGRAVEARGRRTDTPLRPRAAARVPSDGGGALGVREPTAARPSVLEGVGGALVAV